MPVIPDTTEADAVAGLDELMRRRRLLSIERDRLQREIETLSDAIEARMFLENVDVAS